MYNLTGKIIIFSFRGWVHEVAKGGEAVTLVGVQQEHRGSDARQRAAEW
jgi:hypothetical protein